MNLTDKIKYIKFSRMKPEEQYIYNIIIDLVHLQHKEQPIFQYYEYKGKLLFGYSLKTKRFWHDYSFKKSITKKFNIDDYQFYLLMKKMFETYLIGSKIVLQQKRGLFNGTIRNELDVVN